MNCSHTPWVCFYERTSDGKRLAYCQRCGMEGGWQWTHRAAENELEAFPRRPEGASDLPEIFTPES